MYRNARELFEAARDAVRDRESVARQLAVMDSRRHGGSSPIFGGGKGSPRDVNGTAANIAYIDAETRMKVRVEEDERLVGVANAVLYGRDGLGGLAHLLGPQAADAVFWRYLGSETWGACEAACGMSRKTISSLIDASFDVLDAVGVERAVDGVGIAAD